VRDKRIAVLGSGDHGLAEARFIRRYSRDVTLIPADGTLAQPTDGIAGLASPMRRLSLTAGQVIVELDAGEPQRFDTLYVALGTTPRSDLAEALGAARSASGCVVFDDHQQTSIDGVFAIGDIVEGLDQIAFAMGQGAVAAIAIHNSLRES
jgi:thioredoxin reductase (NADPH)